jgi:Phage derived protein Gp49-like (DUF891)
MPNLAYHGQHEPRVSETSDLARQHAGDASRLSSRCARRGGLCPVSCTDRRKIRGGKAAQGPRLGVVEVIANRQGDTYRAVYTMRFADRVYVLHVFQKKSKSGVATPQFEIDLVRQRLKRAAELDKKREH